MTRKRIISLVISVSMIGLVVWMISLRPKDSIAGLVPDHASWYVEVDKPIDILKDIQKGIQLFSNPDLTLFAEWQEELAMADHLFKNEPIVYRFIRNSTIGISAHAITGKEAGYLFYLPMPKAEHGSVFRILKKQYGNSALFRFEEREYLGKSIAEVTFKKTGSVFSLASSEDVLVGSFSGFLVEEVVRKSGIFFKPNFASRLRRDSRYAAFANKPVRLFLQLKNSPDFFYHYVNRNLQALHLSENLGDAMLLGFDGPDGLEWKSQGFVQTQASSENGKRPHLLDPELENFLPSPEVVSFHYAQNKIWSHFPDKKEGMEGPNDLLEKALGDELVIGLTEGDGLKKYNHLLVTRIINPALLDQFLEAVSGGQPRSELYKEKYNGNWIYQHSNSTFAGILGGSVLRDWVPTFYVKEGKYFLISDEIEMMRRSLDHFKSSPKINSFRPAPHHFCFRMNLSKSVPLLMESASGPFKTHFSEWVPLIKSINLLEIKDLGGDENPSLSFNVKWKLTGTSSTAVREVKRVFLDSVVTSGPIRLDARFSDRPIWMFQDVKKQAYLIGTDLKEIFRIPMQERWVSKPQILEEANKRSFSILYSMPHAIRISDDKGVMKPGFSIQLPDSIATMEHVRVVDYEKSLQYRMFIASRYGPVFAADLQQHFLEGWKPWNHGVTLILAPRHIRIGEKDLILMLDKSGKLLLTNRKGEMQPGFPFQLNGRVNQPLFVEVGLGLKNSFVYCLSELGQMEKVNLLGTATSAIQLFRPDKETRFILCPDQKQKTFSVARITATQITVFDQSYRQVFDFQTKSSNVIVQHFQFGASNKVYAINDLEAKQCFLLNESGTLLSNEPIESSQPIDIVLKPGSDHWFLILAAFENRLSLMEFEKD